MATGTRRHGGEAANAVDDAGRAAPGSADGTGRCPICHRPRGSTPRGPFCSERCQLVDLHQWLNGTYRMVTDPSDGPASDAELAAAAGSEEQA